MGYVNTRDMTVVAPHFLYHVSRADVWSFTTAMWVRNPNLSELVLISHFNPLFLFPKKRYAM